MLNIFKKQNGMGIVGQGGKIILFMLPALAAAVAADLYFHAVVALPASWEVIRPAGYVLLALGGLYWATAVIQLLVNFAQGRLVTTGAYGVARNPIYSSVAFMILPAVALLSLTWGYLVVSLFLYAGVMIFIGEEERQMARAFGRQYEDYLARVDRLIPFRRPPVRRPRLSTAH